MGKQYEMAFQIGAKVQGSFGSAFKSASSSVQGLQSTINELNKKQSDISSYQKTQQALENTRAKLKLYEQQYANMKAAIEGNENATYQEQNAMLAKGKAIDDLKAKQEALEGKLKTTGDALQEEGVDMEHMSQASDEAKAQVEALRQEQEELAAKSGDAAQGVMELVGALGAMEALKTVAQAFKECADQAIAFESSMAAVKRTVGGSEDFINTLGEDFKKLSTQIPMTTEELAQIATTAGQLGIEQSKVEQFTTVMAKLATTTDLTADEAATMLAQFANITGVTDYERLGAVIAQLGDSTATTASKVVQMSQGMAASASIAGFSETDIMALAAAVGSLGIEAQAGSTSMSQLISTLYKATETGENLEEFASVAGMSAEQFKKSWGEDAIGTMNRFIQGLNDTERNGKSAVVILDELGITNVRQTKAILGLASAGDLLTNTIAQANEAWASNTALNEKASIMYETTEAKLMMMQNSFSNLKIAIGDAFTPAISAAADALTGLMEPVAEFIEANPALVQGIGAALAVMGGLTAAVVAYTAAAKIAAAVSAALTAAIPGAKLLLAVGAAAAVLTGAIVGLSAAFADNTQSMEDLDAEYDDLTAKYEEQQAIINACERYKELSSEMENVVDTAKQIEGYEDIKIELDADAVQDLRPKDFLIGEDETTTLTGEANTDELVDGSEFIVEGSDQIELTPEAKEGAKLNAEKDFMESTGVKITATPDGRYMLDANVFVKNKNIRFKAEWENKADMEADLATFKENAETAKKNLEEAKATLEGLKEREGQIEARIWNAGSDTDLPTLQSQLAEVTTQIFEQEAKVGALETAYNEAATQFVITAQAVDTLNDKEQELSSLAQSIVGSEEGKAAAYALEKDKIWETVEAKEALAKAEQAELKKEITNNLKDQGKTYAEAYNEYNRQAENFAQLSEDLNNLTTPDDLGERIQRVYEDIGAALQSGDDWDSSKIKQLRTEFTDLMNQANGNDTNLSFANYYAMGAALSQVSISTEDVINAQGDLARQVNDTKDAMENEASIMQTYVDNAVAGITEAGMTTDEVRAMMESSFAEYPNGAQMVEDAMAQVEAAINSAGEAAEDFGEGAAGMDAGAVTEATQPIIDQMNALAESYNKAYEAAYNSISGQFDLFEQVSLDKESDAAKTSVDDMITSLKSQSDYMTEYATNLQKASEMGISDGLLAQLSDGSTESAQYLQEIVSNGSTKIDELNAAFAEVQTGKEKFADTVAEMSTDFTTEMEKLEQTLKSTVEEMNESKAAAEAGKATMLAFAEAAKGMQSTVEGAFAAVASAAAKKLKVKINGTTISIGGYASGTDYAEPGFALVGEKGPELVAFGGGEKVLNASETSQALSNGAEAVSALSGRGSSSFSLNFSPSYNISGGGDTASIQSMLESVNSSLLNELEDRIAEIENDQARRAYA